MLYYKPFEIVFVFYIPHVCGHYKLKSMEIMFLEFIEGKRFLRAMDVNYARCTVSEREKDRSPV